MLQWFESDGVTLANPINLGGIGPGQSLIDNEGNAAQYVLKNTGGTPIDDVEVTVLQAGATTGYLNVRLALGLTEPAANTFTAYASLPLVVGTVDAAEAVNVWVDVVMPIEAPRRAGHLVTLWAYGVDVSVS